ncbi:site-specific DNA-methyltransferase [Tissierella praeacuta]|uniref:site-specific DNA-methyltransferase n=1 Tax=Tissierella praeacuta TaxID=43131 RepID=UPI003512AC95
MDKLNMKSKDMTKDNIEKIERLFPNVITEIKDKDGNITKAIDFELLQQELSGEIVEGNKERYQLTWPGKKEAILMGNTPINKTLRPVKEDSVDWDNTENLYIEGDNLEVIKLLQESYLNKIKCIYIDPPYNTGKDFVYRDNFTQDKDEYLEESGQVDEEGNRLFLNTDANGRYHSDWLTMMYTRLKLARNLLSEDGVIFISIDDNEVHNLRKICDEIFGERNFVCNFIWQKTYSTKNNNKYVSEDHDYIFCYARNLNSIEEFKRLNRTEKSNEQYKYDDNDGRGLYRLDNITASGQRGYNIKHNGKVYKEPYPSGWRFKEDTMYELINDNRIYLPEDENKRPQVKRYLNEQKGLISKTILQHELVGHTDSANRNLFRLLGDLVFDYPKPVELMNYLIGLISDNDSIILDFFSGSATTAHAVMQLNAEDGGNRKYIMVQLPEETDEKSEAYKAGYKTIAEIGKERIRRSAKKIKEETNADIDYGFRVFKVDSSNMKDIYYLPNELTQMKLHELEANIKEDRTGLDLLSQVILEAGLPLSLPMETKIISGKEVYFVDENALIACFEKNIDESLIREIAKMKPLKAVFRDNSFKDCPSRINLEEIFKSMSPTTEIKVL